MHQIVQESSGYAFHTGDITAQANRFTGVQRPTEACATSYNDPSRLKNRSNGTVLPTITEQGSSLTLDACGFLLDSEKLSSFDTVEGNSSSSSSLRALRGSVGYTSQEAPETAVRNQNRDAISKTNKKQFESQRVEGTINDSEAILSPVFDQCPQTTSSLIDNTYLDIDSRSLKGLVHGVFQNVRAALQTGSRSSSTVQSSFMEHRESWPPTTQIQSQSWETNQLDVDRFDTLCHMHDTSLSAASSPRVERQSTNRNTSTADTEYSAHDYPSIFDFPAPPDLKPKTDFKYENRLSPRPATPSRERSFSVRLVQLEPRDPLYKDDTTGARGQSNDIKDHNSARDTFYDTFVSSNHASSFKDGGGGREASPNASFCDTISTSYSGPVLGVDLDLHRNFGPSIRHSGSLSPAITVCSGLQPAELERPLPVSEAPNGERSCTGQLPYRSITSSALTSLLPIATASGIVRPNYNTPKISFYSPSGNLIEPEGSVSSDASASELYNPRSTLITSSTARILSNHSVLYATACLPPSRPSLVPMTTPPTPLAPLPAHLKYHHNYQKPERSQISSSKTFVMPGSAIMGCGGVVKTAGCFPQNVLQSTTYMNGRGSSHNRISGSTISKVRDLLNQASLYQSRLITAAANSRTPSKIAKKSRNQQGLSINTRKYARVSLKPSLDTIASGKESRSGRHTGETNNMQDTSLRSALPGYALRVCFCQPYDGAGQRTHAVAAEASCLNINPAAASEKNEGVLLCSNNVTDIDSGEHLVARTVDHVRTERKKARSSMASSTTVEQSVSRGGNAAQNTVGPSGASLQ